MFSDILYCFVCFKIIFFKVKTDVSFQIVCLVMMGTHITLFAVYFYIFQKQVYNNYLNNFKTRNINYYTTLTYQNYHMPYVNV